MLAVTNNRYSSYSDKSKLKQRNLAQGGSMNNNGFAIADITTGQLNALVKNLMSEMGIDDPIEAVRRINSREWLPFKPNNFWREDGLIHFKVVSDGTTNEEWLKYLLKQGFNVDASAKKMISYMNTTKGVVTEVVICEDAWSINQRLGKKLTTETACLIRKMFSDKDLQNMGLFNILVFHNTGPNLLSIHRSGVGNWLSTDYLEIRDEPGRGVAFAV